jgi:hypothetical protein
MADDDDATPELPMEILRINECFVYKVPPLKPGGHKAADWGLETPRLTGSLRLVAQGETVTVQIFTDKQQMFVACPVFLDPDASKPQAQLEYWVRARTRAH